MRPRAPSDPDDAFEPDDCESVFAFPDSEPLVQAEFEKNLPFALSIAESAKDPAHPVSSVGLTAPDFEVDSFAVSYGDPQTVAVTARRELRHLTMHYRSPAVGPERSATHAWKGGERYGDEGDATTPSARGVVRGARPGDHVEGLVHRAGAGTRWAAAELVVHLPAGRGHPSQGDRDRRRGLQRREPDVRPPAHARRSTPRPTCRRCEGRGWMPRSGTSRSRGCRTRSACSATSRGRSGTTATTG